jgi:hypothetical protein
MLYPQILQEIGDLNMSVILFRPPFRSLQNTAIDLQILSGHPMRIVAD